MTSQKHLKAAVRARMTRTCERYTTARRHVVGDPAGSPPAGAQPGYRTFGGGRHHDSALLVHVLEAAGATAAHDGQPLSEPMVTGLAGGIGFMYFSFSYEGHLPTMTIVPRIHPRPFVLGALERASRTGSPRRRARPRRPGNSTPPSTPAPPRSAPSTARAWDTRRGPTSSPAPTPTTSSSPAGGGRRCCSTTSGWSRWRSPPSSSRPPAPRTGRASTGWSSSSRSPVRSTSHRRSAPPSR